MVFSKQLLEGIRRGRIRCSIRFWTRPHVKVGGRYPLGDGRIVVDAITPIEISDVTARPGARVGFQQCAGPARRRAARQRREHLPDPVPLPQARRMGCGARCQRGRQHARRTDRIAFVSLCSLAAAAHPQKRCHQKGVIMRFHVPLGGIWLVVAATATAGNLACTSQPHEPALHAQTLGSATAVPVARSVVEAQPLGANIERLLRALDYLGAPLAPQLRRDLTAAAQGRDADRLQQLLDDRVLLVVHINPEMRVKVARGPAAAVLAAGWLHAGDRQDPQREPRHATAAHRQPAGGTGLRRHDQAGRRADAAAAAPGERERRGAR